MKNNNPFRYFKTSPEIIRLAVMMYVRFPLSLRNVEDLLHERGIDICHETVRLEKHLSYAEYKENNGYVDVSVAKVVRLGFI
jgi:transposase-like protein